MRIELLWWEGCPSTERALADLRAALAEIGAEVPVEMREVRDDAEAHALRFRGSPTILVDGVDVDEAAVAVEPIGLTCRVYRTLDGRISPTPDPERLRDVLRRAAAAKTTPEVQR